MRCKHCGKKLKYDLNADYVVYNGEIYCNEDCMLYDVDYGFADLEDIAEDVFDRSNYWSGPSEQSDNKMSMKDAMSILIKHNKWRRDIHVHNKYEMVNPTELGKAIEVAIDTLDCMIQNLREPYDI